MGKFKLKKPDMKGEVKSPLNQIGAFIRVAPKSSINLTGDGSKDYSSYSSKKSCEDAGGCWFSSGKTRETSYWSGEEGWIPDSWQGGKRRIESGTCHDCDKIG